MEADIAGGIGSDDGPSAVADGYPADGEDATRQPLPPISPRPIAGPVGARGSKKPWWILVVVLALTLMCALGAAVAGVVGYLGAEASSGPALPDTQASDREDVRALIAEEYPGYTVVQEDVLSDYIATGVPAVRMILEKDSAPGFVMAVDVVQPGDEIATFRDLGMTGLGEYLVSDDVFNQTSIERQALEQDDLDQIISQYLDVKPAPDALIVYSTQIDTYVLLDIDAGIERSGYGYAGDFYPTHIGESDRVYDSDYESHMSFDIYELEEWNKMVDEAAGP